jgi:hypothetical protein
MNKLWYDSVFGDRCFYRNITFINGSCKVTASDDHHEQFISLHPEDFGFLETPSILYWKELYENTFV